MARVRYTDRMLFAIKTVCARGHHVTRPTVEWAEERTVCISKPDNAEPSRCTFFTQTHWKYVVLFNRKLLIFASHLVSGRQAARCTLACWACVNECSRIYKTHHRQCYIYVQVQVSVYLSIPHIYITAKATDIEFSYAALISVYGKMYQNTVIHIQVHIISGTDSRAFESSHAPITSWTKNLMLRYIYYYVSHINGNGSNGFAEEWPGDWNECEFVLQVGADGPFLNGKMVQTNEWPASTCRAWACHTFAEIGQRNGVPYMLIIGREFRRWNLNVRAIAFDKDMSYVVAIRHKYLWQKQFSFAMITIYKCKSPIKTPLAPTPPSFNHTFTFVALTRRKMWNSLCIPQK